MTKLVNVENRISVVEKYLKILEHYYQYSQSDIENSVEKKGSVERYLYLAVQSTIDLAESVISFKEFRKPSSLSDSFYILNEEGLINLELTNKMIQMTGFRNVLSHEYEKIDYKIIYDVLVNGCKDILDFVDVIREKLAL